VWSSGKRGEGILNTGVSAHWHTCIATQEMYENKYNTLLKAPSKAWQALYKTTHFFLLCFSRGFVCVCVFLYISTNFFLIAQIKKQD
jgi:hypothetical protein